MYLYIGIALMVNVLTIIAALESPSRDEIHKIRRAYEFAQKAHAGQKRYSGEPYFVHVYHTALILARLGMGPKTIIAGLLHDTLEDAEVSHEEIEKEFGNEVLFLVEGVTKLGRIRYQGTKRHIESLRKLFVATSQDIRVLIIKLADRLHNMRTLEYVPREKRNRIALETLEVYSPIAYRLGIGEIQRELQDLAFEHAYPEEYKIVKEMSEPVYKARIPVLESVHSELTQALEEERIKPIKIDFRMKGLYSLYLKLRRKDMDIERVYDVAALRIILPTIHDCYKTLGIVHSKWQPLPGRIKDYIAFPKPNGYQSLHTSAFVGEGKIIEIQIRTEKMHKAAEYGIASHARYKEKALGKRFVGLDWFRGLLGSTNVSYAEGSGKENVPEWIKDLVEAQTAAGEQEFMENLKTDFFESRIFVFTPGGDVMDLPLGSSPIDFAYHIHSDIGDHTAGAKVNGKMVSLDTKLQNGDIVEIETRKSSKPTQKWLQYARTTLARRRIRSAINPENKK